MPDEAPHDISELAHTLVEKAVAIAHPGAAPRPGQLSLLTDITGSVNSRTALVSQAPTGSGKTFAALAPALAAAALNSERTIISTGTLALQNQIVDHDIGVLNQALHQTTGQQVSTTLQKGWSNYGCLMAAREHPDLPVAAWLLDGGGPRGDGEKSQAPDPEDWHKVSIPAQRCIGSKCPLADQCFPRRARTEALFADIVITNHATLATQVATGTPVVTGRARETRPFSHLIVDECHQLPDAIRSAATRKLTPGDVTRTIDRWRSSSRHLGCYRTDLDRVASGFADALAARIVSARTGHDSWNLLSPDATPLGDLGDTMSRWCQQARRTLDRRSDDADPERGMQMRGLKTRLAEFRELIDTLAQPEEDSPTRRWVEDDLIAAAPASIAGWCANRLWSYTPTKDAEIDSDDDTDDPRINLTPICLSATVTRRFPRQVGLKQGRFSEHPSPFTQAHAESAVITVGITEGSTAATAIADDRGRFDATRHAAWCADFIPVLVKANKGSALILAATGKAARSYAAKLADSWTGVVYTQWDRDPVNRWKATPGSVLVGTRSLMTGVDAPGGTCTLVIIDRVPRNPINPVDELRVHAETGPDPTNGQLWKARSKIYAEDAADLLRQAVGRLIRSADDRGAVAVLDPRLCPGTGWAFTVKDKPTYLAAVDHFGTKINSFREAVEYLRNRP